MLSKEHLRYHREGRTIKPRLLKITPHWTMRCQEVIDLAQEFHEKPFGLWRDACEALCVSSGRSRKVLKGLCSLLQKKVTLAEVGDDVSEARYRLWGEFVTRQRQATEALPFPEDETCLYPDLEHRRLILELPKWTPKGLVHRYNLATVQGLLLQADKVCIDVFQMKPHEARQFLQYLKFFGLVVDASGSWGERCRFLLGGPLSEMGGGQRYRSRLAAAFGAVPHFQGWRCRAQLQLEGQSCVLDLRDDDPAFQTGEALRSHYRFSGEMHSPEWRVFVDKLEALLNGRYTKRDLVWENGRLEDVNFPDLWYVGEDGRQFRIDLFFAHQRSALESRLSRDLKGVHGAELLLVEHALMKRMGFKESEGLMAFRDIPSIQKTTQFLKKNDLL